MQTNNKAGMQVGSCIAAIVVALASGCGGGGGGGAAGGGGDGTSPPPAAAGTLKAAADGEVLAFFKAQVAERAAKGLNGTQAPVPGGPGPGVIFSPAPAPAVSGTLLQEAGVDEDDRIKSDGTMVYALHAAATVDGVQLPERLTAARINADGSLAAVGLATLRANYDATGMFLAGNRLAVLSQKDVWGGIQISPPVAVEPQQVAIDFFGVATGAAPAQLHRMEIDGWLVASRRIDNVLYVVSSWMPQLQHYAVPANSTPAQVAAALAPLKAEELLPAVRVDGAAPEPLVRESDCYLQPANASLGLQLTTITAIDLTSPTLQRASRCFVGDGNTLYMSKDNVYLASSQQVWIANTFAAMVFPRDVSTDIHKFALRGLAIDYRGSGSVPGHLGWDAEKMPYRMSEHQGDLRVVSYTGDTGWAGPQTTTTPPAARPSPAALTVLRENAASRSLEKIAQLPNAQRPAPLGHEGEQVYAVRFAGPRAYVVTFRRTDPLYVLDLSNPADPKAVGELEMPGFSEYLFPLAGDKLLGIGRDADARGVVGGLKLAVFDVAAADAPRLLASRTLGVSGTSSALDHSRHGVNILEANGVARVALPVLVSEAAARGPAYQGLARWHVDTATGAIGERPLVLATRFDGTAADGQRYARYNLAAERSVQTGKGAYYLSGGEVVFAPE